MLESEFFITSFNYLKSFDFGDWWLVAGTLKSVDFWDTLSVPPLMVYESADFSIVFSRPKSISYNTFYKTKIGYLKHYIYIILILLLILRLNNDVIKINLFELNFKFLLFLDVIIT